ncbi:MAG: adenylate/guanylate cyclase domain-containing protein [Desulfobacterales bacterium]
MDKAFGDALQAAGIIHEDQLRAVREEMAGAAGAQSGPRTLCRIAVEKGWISESDALTLLRKRCGYTGESIPSIPSEYTRARRHDEAPVRRGPRFPIWLQLTFTAAMLMVITILVVSYFFLNRQKEQLYDQSVTIGMISLNYFANEARIALLEGNELQLNSMINDVQTVDGLVYAMIVDRQGIIRAHSDLDRLGKQYEPLASVTERQRKGDVTYFNYRMPESGRILNLEKPVQFKDNLVGYAHVGVSIDFIETIVRKERHTLILMTLPIVAAGLIITLIMGFWFSNPLSRLVDATEEIRRGNYRQRIHLARNDEFGDLAAAFNRMSNELFRNHLMQKSFGKYVGTEVADMILASPESVWLKGRLCEATILFADIRGFTAYSEGRDPEKLVEALNDYFEIATRVIIENGGYVDKFIGDAVLGVFGVPIYRSDHRARGVMAAVEIQRYLREGSRSGDDLLGSVGISVHSGVIVAGNIGSATKMEYTVIGDAVNVASRMNAVAGPGDTVISKAVYDGVQSLVTVEVLPMQKIKGRSEPVAAYRVLSIR